jgi:DNA mismatch repair protein MutL
MSDTGGSSPRRVQVLSESVSRKIAAGEVIDRPYSVVRELIDNSLDAAARTIEVHVAEGGTKSIRVVDDGLGMSREDLELCYLPHATSKIRSEHDLEQVASLGFRGEALSSIGTVSRLRVTSAQDDSGSGHHLSVDAGRLISLGPAPASRGTTVEVHELFYSLPARKRFLKRPSAETKMARAVFTEKALPFNETAFRLFTDGAMKLFLPASDRAERVAAAYPDLGSANMLHSVSGSGDGFELEVLTPGMDLVRRDRKRIQIFVNGRRVWEYGLVQAVEYAFSDYIPGGLFPTAFVFLRVEPELVDFNIHPAKREVRMRNLRDIHARLTRTLNEFLKAGVGKRAREGQVPLDSPELWADASRRGHAAGEETTRRGHPGGAEASQHPSSDSGRPARREAYPSPDGLRGSVEAFDLTRRFEVPEVKPEQVRYLGQAMGVFLVGEGENGLYLVDQHAGHERVLYEQLRNAPSVQRLLVPVPIEVSAEEDELLRARQEDLARAAIEVAPVAEGGWELTAVPAVDGIDAEKLARMLRELSGVSEELERDFYADVACKAAIKDGDAVDQATGERLMHAVFRLETPHCPHGRPLWLEISRGKLFHLIGRTL